MQRTANENAACERRICKRSDDARLILREKLFTQYQPCIIVKSKDTRNSKHCKLYLLSPLIGSCTNIYNMIPSVCLIIHDLIKGRKFKYRSLFKKQGQLTFGWRQLKQVTLSQSKFCYEKTKIKFTLNLVIAEFYPSQNFSALNCHGFQVKV